MPNDDMRTKDFAVEEIEVKADDRYPGGVISGYASVFGNVDRHNEIVKPGAFKKTLKEIGSKGVYLMDNHRFHGGTDAVIGRTFLLEERKRGLYFEAFFSEAANAQAVRQKVKEGILDRLSFGFSVVKEQLDRTSGVRELIELKLHEISVVMFPANPEAGIATVKAEDVVPAKDSATLRGFRATLQGIKARPATQARRPAAELLKETKQMLKPKSKGGHKIAAPTDGDREVKNSDFGPDVAAWARARQTKQRPIGPRPKVMLNDGLADVEKVDKGTLVRKPLLSD